MVDVLSAPALAGAEVEMVALLAREYLLRRALETMQDILRRNDEYSYLNDTAVEFLLAARTSYRQAVLGEVPVVVLGERACLWFTWTGTRVQRTLMLLADRAGLSAVDRRIAIRFEATPEQVVARFDDVIDYKHEDGCRRRHQSGRVYLGRD